MTNKKPGKSAKKRPESAVEIKEEDLDKASGGAVDAFLAGQEVSSGPGDEGPEESITFVYGKLGVKYEPQR